MDIVKLVDYVKDWELFDKIDFDQIVSDYDFSDFVDEWFIRINVISDLKKIDKTKKTLFILDKLKVDNISELFDMSNFSILDMNVWMFSYWKKIWISKMCVSDFASFWLFIYEPMDLFSFLCLFDSVDNKYIRIANLDLPENFVWWNYWDIISLEDKWFLDWTISLVSWWQFFPEIVRLGNLLKEQWLQTNIFVLNRLDFDDASKFQYFDNFIFLLDSFCDKWYENIIKNKLKWKNINFFYPKYDNLATVFDEYKMEELEFDVESLAKKMISYI
jgi:hypothetical protein